MDQECGTKMSRTTSQKCELTSRALDVHDLDHDVYPVICKLYNVCLRSDGQNNQTPSPSSALAFASFLLLAFALILSIYIGISTLSGSRYWDHSPSLCIWQHSLAVELAEIGAAARKVSHLLVRFNSQLLDLALQLLYPPLLA
jgi:hypothetical protein